MRKEFKLTDEQMKRLLDACQPVPYLVFNGIAPRSPQENANAAWGCLGRELGFDGMSVQPVHGKDQTYFTAEVTAEPQGGGDK